MRIRKLKKRDYLKVVKLIREIAEEGFIQRNLNKFLADKDAGFADVLINMYGELAEVIAREDIQEKIDELLLKTVRGLTQEQLEDMDLDTYLELLQQFVEVNGLTSFLKKYIPAASLEEMHLNL